LYGAAWEDRAKQLPELAAKYKDVLVPPK
jgi:hypothetical protein